MKSQNTNTEEAFKKIGFKVNHHKSMEDYIKANPKGKIAREQEKSPRCFKCFITQKWVSIKKAKEIFKRDFINKTCGYHKEVTK